jgi:hypothetical protein
MGADLGSEHHPHRHDPDTTDTPRLHAAPSHPESGGDTPDNTSESGPDRPVWWYDQHAKRVKHKHRRYIGYVKRVGGTEGERIRRELAATIYDLLNWAKQQTDVKSIESGEDGERHDNPE